MTDTPPLGYTFTADPVRIIDGDTLIVRVGREIRVRLLDCWSPELRSKDYIERLAARAAKEHLDRLTRGRELTVHVPTEGTRDVGDLFSFDRILATVYLPTGESVAKLMCDAGHAKPEK